MRLPGRRSSGTVFGALLAELREEQRRRAPPRAAAPTRATVDEATGSYAPPAASPLSPLGALLDEMRAQRRAAPNGRPHRAPTVPFHGSEPRLSLETGVVTARRRVGQARLVPLSLVLHAALLAGVVLVPLFRAQQLPATAGMARAFFAEPPTVQPLPPPPAPPQSRSVPPSAQPRPAAARRTFTAPLRVPDGIAADAVIDLGDPAGEAGGVEGGIPGGVVGAVVGTPPPPPTPVVPVRVGRGIQEPEKVRHVPPVYPAIAVRAGVSGTVVLECLVSPQGRVTGVQVLRGIPLLDAAAVEAVRQWVYTPTLRAGAPVPVILTVTVTFALDSGKGR